eukprot:gene5274-10554_t
MFEIRVRDVKSLSLQATPTIVSDSSLIPFSTAIFPCFLCFLPIFLGFEYDYGVYDKENSPLTTAVMSNFFIYSMIFGVGITSPIIFEFIFDMVSGKNDRQVFIPFNWILVLVLPILILLSAVIPTSETQLYISTFSAQRVLYVHTFLYYMNSYGPTLWSSKLCISIGFIFSIGMISVWIVGFICNIESFSKVKSAYNMTAYISAHALDTRKMFIRYASHGIRNPLDVVLLGLKVLYDDMEKTENNWDRLETVQNIKESCNSAITVLDDLLAYDKLESGLSEPSLETFRPWNFLRDTIRPFRGQGMKAGIEFIQIISPETISELDSMFLRADKQAIGQVLRNVISNAFKFTPCGGSVTFKAVLMASSLGPKRPSLMSHRRPSVTLLQLQNKPSATGTGQGTGTSTVIHNKSNGNGTSSSNNTKKSFFGIFGWRNVTAVYATSNTTSFADDRLDECNEMLHIQVIDTGPGLTKESQSRLLKGDAAIQFSPGNMHYDQSSGLGLWIAGSIIEMHGGKLSLSSEGTGQGCVYTIDIPLYQPHSDREANNNNIINNINIPTIMRNKSSLPLINSSRRGDNYSDTNTKVTSNSDMRVDRDKDRDIKNEKKLDTPSFNTLVEPFTKSDEDLNSQVKNWKCRVSRASFIICIWAPGIIFMNIWSQATSNKLDRNGTFLGSPPEAITIHMFMVMAQVNPKTSITLE